MPLGLSTHETHFEDAGSLASPGPIGRAVRLFLGSGCLWALAATIHSRDDLIATRLPDPGWIWLGALALWVLPPVVNIGWGLALRSWPRWIALAAVGVSALASGLVTASWWSPAAGVLSFGILVYTFGHLGVSFLIAAAIRTPGCEMRAIPHLISKVAGRTAREHFCPGALRHVDAWEQSLRDEKR